VSLPYRKKLIEVALPLEAINRESARETSICFGHHRCPAGVGLACLRLPDAASRIRRP
jgi:putative DNA methylase